MSHSPTPACRLLHFAFISFITGFSGAVMPGPMLALTIGQTSQQGFVAVPIICAGHALLELIIVGLLIAGLRSVIAKPVVRILIGWLGGAVLIYFGCDMVRSFARIAIDFNSSPQASLPWEALMFAGAAVCIANPYFLGWWATIGSGQMAALAPRSAAEYLIFYIGHECSDLAWYSLIGVLIVSGRRWLSGSVYQSMVLICGASIVVLGIGFILLGLRTLLHQHRQRTVSD